MIKENEKRGKREATKTPRKTRVSKGRGKEMFERKRGRDKKRNNWSLSFGFKLPTNQRLADKFNTSLFYS